MGPRAPTVDACQSSGPERTIRAGGSFVVDTFFVWTANDPVRHHDRLSSSVCDEREHFLRHIDVVANIAAFGEPALEVRDLGIFGGHDTDSELRCQGIVWAIKGHSRHRVAPEPLLGSLVQPLACALQHSLTPSRPRPRSARMSIMQRLYDSEINALVYLLWTRMGCQTASAAKRHAFTEATRFPTAACHR